MTTITTLNKEAARQYAIAEAYLLADLKEKQGRAEKVATDPDTGATLRETLIGTFGTGETIIGDVRVLITPGLTQMVVDNLALDAFLQKHGLSVENFKVERPTEPRVSVKRVV